MLRRFRLNRREDVSGISGTGYVVEGVQFTDGKVAARWLTPTATIELADSIADFVTIHGHDGATVIEWVDIELIP